MPVKFNVKVNFDVGAVKADILKAADKAIPEVADQVLSDSNEFAPLRDGGLIGKSKTDQDTIPIVQPIPEEQRATVAWRVPYAAYVYKGKSRRGNDLTYSKDLHPKAGKEWFKEAKKLHLADWKAIFEKKLKGHLKK